MYGDWERIDKSSVKEGSTGDGKHTGRPSVRMLSVGVDLPIDPEDMELQHAFGIPCTNKYVYPPSDESNNTYILCMLRLWGDNDLVYTSGRSVCL